MAVDPNNFSDGVIIASSGTGIYVAHDNGVLPTDSMAEGGHLEKNSR